MDFVLVPQYNSIFCNITGHAVMCSLDCRLWLNARLLSQLRIILEHAELSSETQVTINIVPVNLYFIMDNDRRTKKG